MDVFFLAVAAWNIVLSQCKPGCCMLKCVHELKAVYLLVVCSYTKLYSHLQYVHGTVDAKAKHLINFKLKSGF